MLLIDVRTEQGIPGHGYLAPYLDTATGLPLARLLGARWTRCPPTTATGWG